jgi:hypothetical protein
MAGRAVREREREIGGPGRALSLSHAGLTLTAAVEEGANWPGPARPSGLDDPARHPSRPAVAPGPAHRP